MNPTARQRTRIIAHRGASGYLPEHTLAAKALAYGLGADFLEQDLIATRDRELVVLHDIVLDDVSDAALRFPDRKRRDGHFYAVDFTLGELQNLTLHERRQPGETALRYAGRFPLALDSFKIVRFEDEVDWVTELNLRTGRNVGLYPEIKEPAWHREAGIDLPALVLTALERVRERSTPVFLQSFDADTLVRIQETPGADWPLVQLIDEAEADRLAAEPAELEHVASYAAGLGLPYTALIEPAPGERNARPTPLARAIEEAGLVMHPYTLRRERGPADRIAYEDALQALIHDLEVDAVFCDFPDDGVRIRDRNGV